MKREADFMRTTFDVREGGDAGLLHELKMSLATRR